MGDDETFVDVYRQIGDVTVNSTSQTFFTTILLCVVVALAVFGVVDWVRTGRPLVLVLLPAAAITSMLEPITDIAGHLYVFEDGANVAFTLAGRSMPVWVLLGHMAAWTIAGYLGSYLVSRGCTAKAISALGLVGVAGNLILEVPVTHSGLESYWGTQPLMIFGSFPISWAFSNMSAGIVAGAAIGAAWNHLHGWRILAVIPLVPSLVAGGIWITAWPFWIGMNHNYLTASPDLWVATLAAIASIILSLTYTNVAGRVLCSLPGPTAAREARKDELTLAAID